jgi:hypothetical protein
MSEFPREPTREERDILDFLVEANDDDSGRLAALLTETRVTKECRWGFGSLDLTVAAAEARDNWPEEVWGDIGLRHEPLPVSAVADGDPAFHAFLHVARTDAQLEMLRGGLDKSNLPPLPSRDRLRAKRSSPEGNRQSSR